MPERPSDPSCLSYAMLSIEESRSAMLNIEKSCYLSCDMLSIVAEYMNCRLIYVNPKKYTFVPKMIEYFAISDDAMHECRPS